MKVAILVSNASVTGIGLYNTLICKALNRNDIESEIFVFSTTEAINDFSFYKDTNTGYIMSSFNDETYNTLNSYDYIFMTATPHVSEGDEYKELAQKYLPNGSCGVMAFAVKGGRDKAIRFMDSLKLATIATHVADARTCLLHPASHTHRQLSDQQLLEAGIAPDLIRLSVGIEDPADLLADLQQALEG